jgi:predicted nucleic acid-binding protein
MNVVDSSGWLEYFADGPNARYFSKPLLDASGLIVPTITIYEVFKVVLREKDEGAAIRAIALMRQGTVVDLDQELAIQAAKLSIDYKVPMADSIIIATARRYDATIWTQDEDFERLSGVNYFKKAAKH